MRNRFFIGLASAAITFGTLAATLGPRYMACGRNYRGHHHYGHHWGGHGYNCCDYPAAECGSAKTDAGE